MQLTDFSTHQSDWVEPIRSQYRGCEAVELPPNNQGLAVLIALNVLEGFPVASMSAQSTDHIHCMIESMKSGFADSQAYVGDPRELINLSFLLSKSYAESRRGRLSLEKAVAAIPGEVPPSGRHRLCRSCRQGS
jgi:gamma-glutamyltranspeptidase/glutathione hydrolase